ncbi:MAG: CHAT domain-containing protein [Deltaproteobacteria bacterium]|nr:CHAT domain-containing protein [Deltaproteobacteria bacterium]
MNASTVHIELRRAAATPTPLTVAGDGAWYQLRVDGGPPRAVSIPWTKGWLQDLANLRKREHVGAALRRLGAQLARMLEDAGWVAARAKLRQARRDGALTRVVIESDAAELFRLPWELLPVDPKGTPLQAVLDAPIRYTWLAQPAAAGPRPDQDGAGLIAGTGPERLMGAHLAALRATATGTPWVDPDRDFLINASLGRVAEEAAARAGVAPLSLLHLLCRAGGSEERPVVGLGSDTPGLAWADHTADALREAMRPLLNGLQVVILSVYERNAVDEGASNHALFGLSLHLAGAPAVICPRWPLSPEGMTRFTEVFHRGLLRENQSVEDALLHAFRALAREGRPGDAAALQLLMPAAQPSVRPYRFRPFPGLAPFGMDRASAFFGRSHERDAVLAAMQRLDVGGHPRLLAVVGAAHTGKSSLVFAGVLPALLARGGEPGWTWAWMRPGDQPLAELDRALPAERPRNGRLLLIVDQLDEALSGRVEAAEARRFINRLWALAAAPGSDFMVLCTLRVDALGRCANIPLEPSGQSFDAVLYDDHHRVFLREPGPQQLQEIVHKPLEAVGYSFQDDLGVRLVFDAGATPGALPRLSLLLDLLWRGNPTGGLSRPAAGKLGGVQQVVAQHAEATWGALDPNQAQPIARALLLALIDREPGRLVRRLRRPLSAARATVGAGEVVDEVVERLCTAGLLRRSGAPTDPSLELSSDLLLDEWPRLRQWVLGDRAPAVAAPAPPKPSAPPSVPGRPNLGLWAAVAGLGVTVVALLVWINRAPEAPPPSATADLPADDRTTAAVALRQLRPVDRPATWIGEANRLLQGQLAAANLDHGGEPVDDAFFSADGELLATVSGGTLRLFQLPKQQPMVTIRPPATDGGVLAASFLPNGLELVTVARSGAVHRWSRDGVEVTPLRPADPDGATPVAAFSPSGGHLLVASRGRWVVLDVTGAEVASGTIPTRSDGSVDLPVAVAVSDEARNWVVGTEGGKLHLHAPGGAEPETLTLDGLDELVINGAGSALIALGDGTMRIVDMRRASGSQRTPKQVKVHAAAFSVDGDHIVVDFYDGDHDEHRARIAKVAERHDQRSTPPLPGPASALALRADPERLYRGTPTGQVVEVDLGRGRMRRVFSGHRGAVQRVTIDPRGRWLATAGAGGLVRLWSLDAETQAMTHQAPLPMEGSQPQVLSATGDAVAGVDPDGLLWSARLSGGAGAKSRGKLPPAPLQLGVAAWGEGTRLVVATADDVHVWDDIEWRAPLPGHPLALGPGGERLAVAVEGAVALVRPRPGEAVEELRLPASEARPAVAFDSQGQWVAIGGSSGQVQIYDSRTGRLHHELTLQDEAVRQLCVSADGEHVAGAGATGPVSTWSAAGGRRVAEALGVGELRSCAFSPDGAQLLLTDKDSALGVDLRELTPLYRTPAAAPGLGLAASFDAEGGDALVLDPEGHVRRWLSSPAELSRRLWAATRTCPDEPGPDGLLARCACERCLGDESEQCAAIAAEAEQQVKLSGWCPRGG